MGKLIVIHLRTMVKALNWLLYLHVSLIMLNQGRKVRKAPTRVKHGKSVPLARAKLKLPY